MTTHSITPSTATPGAPSGPTTATTRALLACGVVASPLFIGTGLIQAATRDGFDLRRHPFSMLSLGDLGWIQITDFVLSGLLFIACAVGMRRALRPGPGRIWGPRLIGAYGGSTIGGGVFLADPALGFPVGAPAGAPAVLSWHGNLHGVAFAVGFGSLIAAFVVFARRFAALSERGWARYSVATAAAFVAVSALGIVGGDFRIVTVAIVLGWGWVSLLAASIRRTIG